MAVGPDTLDQLLRLHGGEELGRAYLIVRLARYNVAGHIDYSETSRILSSIRRRADWSPAWTGAGDEHLALAETAASRKAFASAGDGFLRAALCYHWASMFATGEAKSESHRRSLEVYSKGAPHYEPPSERIEIPFGEDVLPAYVRKPAGVNRPPVVIMLGGADTNKEELHHWGTEFTRRGLCAVPFDGPGQGELSARYGRSLMRFDTFHEAVSKVVDHLVATRPDLDTDRLGLFGNSLGGYLALDAAARDGRIKAVISNGGFADARDMDGWPPSVFMAFSSCLGFASADEVADHIRTELDLSRAPRNHFPPTLVVHGGREDLSDEAESRAAAEQAKGTLLVVEDAWHTCTNRDHLASPIFGDWMAAALDDRLPELRPEVIRAKDHGDYSLLL